MFINILKSEETAFAEPIPAILSMDLTISQYHSSTARLVLNIALRITLEGFIAATIMNRHGGSNYYHTSSSPYINRIPVTLPPSLYKPPQEYGITSISNPLEHPIEFEVQNEGGDYSKVVLQSGEEYIIRHLYPGGKVTSPRLFVRFRERQLRIEASEMPDNEVVVAKLLIIPQEMKNYKLVRYRSTDPSSKGKTYKFSKSEGLIDLFDTSTEDLRRLYKFNGGTFVNLSPDKWILKEANGDSIDLDEKSRSREQITLSSQGRIVFRLTDFAVERLNLQSENWQRFRIDVSNSNDGWSDLRHPKDRAPMSTNIDVPVPSAGIPELDWNRPPIERPRLLCCCQCTCCCYRVNCCIERNRSCTRLRCSSQYFI